MRNIDSCYLCDTPYQIMVAISIAMHLKETADMYITDSFPEAAMCAHILSSKGIFTKVCVINFSQKISRNKIRQLRWLKHIFYCLNFESLATKILIHDTRYTHIYISSIDVLKRIILFYLFKHFPSIQLIYFDDGSGSYFNDHILKIKDGEYLLWRILIGKKAYPIAQTQWLYSPTLYYKLHNSYDRNIRQVPLIFQSKNNILFLNEIFCFKNSDKINEKIILFDCVAEQLFTVREQKKVFCLYQMIFDYLGMENIVIKKHPRDRRTDIPGKKYYTHFQIPFECVCMNIDCENKILISISSTAVCTPKLLLGKEPRVILLYKLVKSYSTDFVDEDRYYSACKSLYSVPERFVIPTTLTELIKVLKKVSCE